MPETEHKRILLKFSGESVAGNDEHGIDPKILDQMADSVKSCRDLDRNRNCNRRWKSI